MHTMAVLTFENITMSTKGLGSHLGLAVPYARAYTGALHEYLYVSLGGRVCVCVGGGYMCVHTQNMHSGGTYIYTHIHLRLTTCTPRS